MPACSEPVLSACTDAEPRAAGRSEGEAALRAELSAAVDHDLRTALTTVLGALQTISRPELAPADPDLAALLSSALGQAQRMRRLLDELVAASSPLGRPLLPADLAHLIGEAAGEGPATTVDVPADLDPVHLSAPGLRRALAEILRAALLRGPARVTVAHEDGNFRITITAGGGEPPAVPRSAARLVETMGGMIEQAPDAGAPILRLSFPRAFRGRPG